MIAQPELYIEEFAEAGADYIIPHVETAPHLHRLVQQIRDAGARPGVALNPSTSLTAIEEIVEYVEMVIVMTVNPGFGGQAFIHSMLPKISKLRQMLGEKELDCDIEVDGGINPETAPLAVEAGANLLVAGSAVYGTPDGVAGAMKRMLEAVR
jgi:ribulose-phosphate 3-epimerase